MIALRILFDVLVTFWIITTVWFAIRIALPLSTALVEEARWRKLHPGMPLWRRHP